MTPADFLILIVDDNAPNRYVKTHTLARAGYRVIEAASGGDGLAAVRERQPDLVLLDIRLPDINGIEICRAIKADPAIATTMVLQTSAVSISTPDKVGALEAGADGYLAEPAEREELLAVVRALLRLRQSEQALRAAQERAEAAMADKSRFLATASHDLRQPLQAASLFLSLLQSRVSEPQAISHLEQVADSLTAADGLLQALMTISTLDNPARPPVVAAIDLPPLLERLEQEYRPSAAAKGLDLRLRIWPMVREPRSGDAVRVMTDAVMFERILRNFISNAIRYTDAGGVLIAARRRDGMVRVEVVDTGIGIADQDRTRIYDDFFQVGNAARNRELGYGLGLSIVRRMAAVLGHRLDLRSTVGRGSRFVVLAPAAAPSTAIAAKRDVTATPIDAERVLVIEDDAVQAEALKLLLSDWGCAVSTAQTAEEALDVADGRCDFQAVITDFRLPAMNGVELLDTLKARGLRFRCGIVQTGDTDRTVGALVTGAGYDLLHKPYRASDLKALLTLSSSSPHS